MLAKRGVARQQAQDYSAQLWATENQDWLVLGLGAGVALVAVGAYLGYQSQQNSQDDKIKVPHHPNLPVRYACVSWAWGCPKTLPVSSYSTK